MPEADALLLFVLATLTLNVTPGPDMLYVVARSAGQGRSAGIVSALGIAAGCVVHTLLVACGVAGLLRTAPTAFEVIKYAGAAYLIYLGVRARAGRRRAAADVRVAPSGLSRVFLLGMLTNLLNPKVALFFLAFLTQFANASRGHVALQILMVGLLFNLLGTTVNVVVMLRAGMRPSIPWLRGSDA